MTGTIAISGLARHFQSRLNDEYVAGMWRGTFPDCLLWYVRKSAHRTAQGRVSCQPRKYRAPSWSWLSIEAREVLGPEYHLDPQCEHELDIKLDCVDNDLTGLIRSGRLMLINPEIRPVVLAVNPDQRRPTLVPDLIALEADDLRFIGHVLLDNQLDNIETFPMHSVLYYVTICDFQKSGLLLARVWSDESATYRRIGVVQEFATCREPSCARCSMLNSYEVLEIQPYQKWWNGVSIEYDRILKRHTIHIV